MVKNYQTTRGERSITTKAKKYCTEINLVFNDLFNKDKHQVKYTIKQHTIKKKIEVLNSKLMHGQFQHELNQLYINKKLLNVWLSDSRLKGATESIIFFHTRTSDHNQIYRKTYIKHRYHSRM